MRRTGWKLATPEKIYNLILSRCKITENGCWLWLGCVKDSGYGRIRIDNKEYITHVFMWEYVNGPKTKIDLHHIDKCGNKRCCNPVHLENLTRKEHILVTPTHILNPTTRVSYNKKKNYE